MASGILKGFLSYASKLYSDGEISEKTYKFLVRQALAEYIQESIDYRIERVIENELSNLIVTTISKS